MSESGDSSGHIGAMSPLTHHQVTDPYTRVNFKCPVPRCGRTFTHHYNLRSHIRSHSAAIKITGTPIRELFDCLVELGCSDMDPALDPACYSSCVVATGGFGDIWKGRLRSGTDVAIKLWRAIPPMEGDEKIDKTVKRSMRELYNWSNMNHENIQKLLGVVIFQGRLGMVSPWMANGTLRNFIKNNSTVDRHRLCIQVATGVHYMHDQDIVHGDLKGSNILVSEDGIVKITDFDYSILAECNLFTDTTRIGGGTTRWMAPELLGGKTQRNKPSDVYSLGMTLLEIITGDVPYPQCRREEQVAFRVLKNQPPEQAEHFGQVRDGEEAWKLFQRCWELDTNTRPTAYEVLNSLHTLKPIPVHVVSRAKWEDKVSDVAHQSSSSSISLGHDSRPPVANSALDLEVGSVKVGIQGEAAALIKRGIKRRFEEEGEESGGERGGPFKTIRRDYAGVFPDHIDSSFSKQYLAAAQGEEIDGLLSDAQPAAMIQSGQLSCEEIFRYLVGHGCADLSSDIDPSGYSSGLIQGGAFGDIWKGKLRDGTEVAIKVWRFTSLLHNGPKAMKRAMREIYYWSKVKHEHVQELMGVTMFQGRLGMVSLWMEHGNLREYICKNPKTDRYSLCMQVATGVAYLHSQGMVHGDIKAADILISRDGVAKLNDFDHSIMAECSLVFSDTSKLGGGTTRWMAPELILDDSSTKSTLTDVYSLGMTMLEIITGTSPYYPQCQDDVHVIMAMMKRKLPIRPSSLADNPRDNRMWELLLCCWEYEPLARPSTGEVVTRLQGIMDLPAGSFV